MSFLNNLGQGLSNLYNQYIGGANNAAHAAAQAPEAAQVPPQPSDSDSDIENEILHEGSAAPVPPNASQANISRDKSAAASESSGPEGLGRVLRKAHSIMDGLMLLKHEAMSICEGKVRRERAKLQEFQDQSTLFNRILEKVSAQKNAQGELDTSNDAEIRQLLSNAKRLGLSLPHRDGNIETRFTKDQTDGLVRGIEYRMRDVSKKIEMQMNAIDEAMSMRNKFFEAIKSLFDQLKKIIEMILQAIRQTGK
jgi:hypothetical protein